MRARKVYNIIHDDAASPFRVRFHCDDANNNNMIILLLNYYRGPDRTRPDRIDRIRKKVTLGLFSTPSPGVPSSYFDSTAHHKCLYHELILSL